MRNPLNQRSGSYAWIGVIDVNTVDGSFNHSVERGMGLPTINGLIETLVNLYQAGVEDTQPEYRNPPMSEAVSIQIYIEKEVF